MSTTTTATQPAVTKLDELAIEAMKEVVDGMRLGLGTGRAAEAFIRRLGAAVDGGMKALCVATSIRSERLAQSLGIELATLDEVTSLDIAFDGADEVTPQLDLTKGLGGALLRERVVAHTAKRFVVLVTAEKCVPRLGSRTHIPIEVVPFAGAVVTRAFAELGGTAVTRKTDDGLPYRTDNGNLILDTQFGPIEAPQELDAAVRAVPGVVDTGLFLGMADAVLVGGEDGVERLERRDAP